MEKLLGVVFLGIGIGGSIYEWLMRHLTRKRRMNMLLDFLRSVRFTMEESNIFWISFLEEYISEDALLQDTCREVAKRLKEHTYPKGELAWQTVVKEKEAQWDLSPAAMEILLDLGKGFFGKTRKENLDVIVMHIRLLQECKEKEHTEFGEKKKIWIPVGLLGGVMLVIVLI